MKILYISSLQLFPVQNGGAQVTSQYLEKLSHNNEVALITVQAQDSKSKSKLLNNIEIHDYLSNSSIIKFLSPLTYARIFIQINKYKPSKLIMDFPWFGMIGILSRSFFKIPYQIKSHNVEYSRMKRLHKWFWYILKIYEKIVYKYAEKIICISELDKKTLEENLNVPSRKIDISEYFPDLKVFKKNIKSRKMVRKLLNIENNFVVLFFGPLDYKPNIEAVNIIRSEIAPYVLRHNNNVVFLVVGRNPNKLKSTREIVFTGYVQNIEDYINACDVVIVPLISGGGVRTKILESLACGKKVISTKIGSEGILKLADETNLIIAPISNASKTIIKISYQIL